MSFGRCWKLAAGATLAVVSCSEPNLYRFERLTETDPVKVTERVRKSMLDRPEWKRIKNVHITKRWVSVPYVGQWMCGSPSEVQTHITIKNKGWSERGRSSPKGQGDLSKKVGSGYIL